MNRRLAVVCALLLTLGRSASAHRLDEYLQATTLSVAKDRLQMQMRLTPGVGVFYPVLANMDTDADGVISEAEQKAYAGRVIRDLSLTLDGDRLRLRLVSWKFAQTAEMKEGLGDIQLDLTADVTGSGGKRRLVFENHHLSLFAVYLVNGLMPSDPDIRVTAQHRNFQQSRYELEYVQSDVGSDTLRFAHWSGLWGWLSITILLLSAGLALRRRGKVVNGVSTK